MSITDELRGIIPEIDFATNRDRLRAIADLIDMKHELGRGTCHIVKTWSDSDYVDGWRYHCSECRCFIPVIERDPDTGDVISAANYCPNCGRRVVAGEGA